MPVILEASYQPAVAAAEAFLSGRSGQSKAPTYHIATT